MRKQEDNPRESHKHCGTSAMGAVGCVSRQGKAREWSAIINNFEEVFDDAWKEWQAIDETEIGLKENIDEIKDFGKTDLETARNKKTMDDVMRWLEMTKITFDGIVVVDENYLKGNLDYDIFIDDSPIQVMEIANLDKVALIYDQPWNRHISSSNNLIRIKNFTEVISYIKNSKFRNK